MYIQRSQFPRPPVTVVFSEKIEFKQWTVTAKELLAVKIMVSTTQTHRGKYFMRKSISDQFHAVHLPLQTERVCTALP